MRRSFLTAVAAATVLALGACGPADTETQIEPVEEVPPPIPVTPMPPDTLPPDTLPPDTLPPDTMPGQ